MSKMGGNGAAKRASEAGGVDNSSGADVSRLWSERCDAAYFIGKRNLD
jgi:hypothetical protein